ncbi:MAG: N-acetylmuramoyl-L-alanine amidase [Ferruginibacter sp.]
MLPFAYYLMKVIACSAILFAYYWFFLRNKIFHSYNRVYLLAVVILSLTAPVMKFNFWQSSDAPKTSVIKMLQVVSNSDEYMDEVIIYSSYKHIDKAQLSLFLFLITCVFMALIFTRSILKIYKLKKESPRQQYLNVNLIFTEDKSSPFSFLKNIFWNNGIDINSKNGKRILKHELAHVQEKHSHDKLFINIIMIIFWCNPIFWLLRKELNLIHEFLADKKAVEDGDTAAFASMILQTTYPSQQFSITNNFFYSPIKRRLSMLTKNNRASVNYISRLFALPLVFFIIAAFTLKAKNKLAVLTSPVNKTYTVVIDAGHGGKDNGATSATGVYEKNIVLTLTKKIKAINTNANIKIILTRETDIYQSPQEKASFAKEAGADLFISVHMSGTDIKNADKMTGLAIYVAKDQYPNSNKSKLFASALVKYFQDDFGLDVKPNPEQRQGGIWILQANDFPSVLIEAGFITNKKDLEYIQTESGTETFAKAILTAITNYIENNASVESGKSLMQNATSVSKPGKNNTDTGWTEMEGNVTVDFNTYNKTKEKTLLIINGKPYLESLENKSIKANKARVYEKNNTEMINKYGKAAANGVLMLENATIENSEKPGSYTKVLNNIKNGTDSTYAIDASEYVRYADEGSRPSVVNAPAKTINLQEPTLTLSGISQAKIPISKLKNIKALETNNPNYTIKSATVYFTGRGFPNVIQSSMNSGSLQLLQTLLDRVVPGTTIVFDNVRIVKNDGSGMMEIKGKAFGFYDKENDILMRTDEEKVFTKVEQEPEFPGGKEAWIAYLKKNLDATIPVQEGWKDGTYPVIVKFIVDKNGKLSDVVAENYKGSKTAQASVDLIKNSPAWIPAKQYGKSVTAYKKQPITFVVMEQ